MKAYVGSHLADAALGAKTIAAAHHVSVRHLYKTCAKADLQLEQLIILQRLERAREDLARSTPAPLSVSAVSQRWAFVSASHFARRFRDAYGLSPREWQTLVANSHPQGPERTRDPDPPREVARVVRPGDRRGTGG